MHIYYVFSSTLLASCSEAMTERCGGLLSSSTALGQQLAICVCSVDISFKRQFRDKLCQIARTFERGIVTSTFS
ncbi:hypothetical protein [Nostoc sp. DedSLP04]|uniref:hypothetical protein n=1 Tax=Nostoc sp. DedSLP04 TaxID=3075401 RepID=UPI002AD20E23|nr:hypothetical protein [Nostoc sp. DedSLP04]MDZ8035557.1 hypothetical protein [Nostoc sp. DedSLP04]